MEGKEEEEKREGRGEEEEGEKEGEEENVCPIYRKIIN